MRNPSQIDPFEKRWFAIYTRFKCEKWVHRQLRQKGIEAYVPLRTVTRKYRRKVKKVHLPLIHCYAFVKINKSEYIRVLETENVQCFVRFDKQLVPIPEDEMNLLKRVAGDDVGEWETRPLNAFQPGDRVEVIGGPLTGLQGVFLEQKGKRKFLVELHTLGYGIAIETDGRWVQKHHRCA